MEQQVSQRSIKKYMVLFPVLALLVCFVILKGADMESVWNAMKECEAAMAGSRAYTCGGIQYRGSDQSEERIEFILDIR